VSSNPACDAKSGTDPHLTYLQCPMSATHLHCLAAPLDAFCLVRLVPEAVPVGILRSVLKTSEAQKANLTAGCSTVHRHILPGWLYKLGGGLLNHVGTG